MKRKALLIIAGISTAALVAVGVYAFGSGSSDVSDPVPTPDSNSVRYHVVGTSMDPTIKEGDWLLATTHITGVKRGDIILMRYPEDESKVYCRRVVGVEGDRVVMRYYSNVKITTVYSNGSTEGKVFPEGVAPASNAYSENEVTVEKGMVYVVGDNTVPGGSFDSDEWGQLPLANVAGLVVERQEPDPRKF